MPQRHRSVTRLLLTVLPPLLAVLLALAHLVGSYALSSPPGLAVSAWAVLTGYALLVGRSGSVPVRLALLAVPVALAAPTVAAVLERMRVTGVGYTSYSWLVYSPTGAPLEPDWSGHWQPLLPLLVTCLALAVLVGLPRSGSRLPPTAPATSGGPLPPTGPAACPPWAGPVEPGELLPGPGPGSSRVADRLLAVLLGAAFLAWLVRDLTYRWAAEEWTPGGFVRAALPPVLLAGATLGWGLLALLRPEGRVGGRVLAAVALLCALVLLATPWPVRERILDRQARGEVRSAACTGAGGGFPNCLRTESFSRQVPGPDPVPLPEFTPLTVPPALVLLQQVVAVGVLLVGYRVAAGGRTRARGAVRPGS